jgi:hypothetical protein
MSSKYVYYVASSFEDDQGHLAVRVTEVYRDDQIQTWEQVMDLGRWLETGGDAPPGPRRHTVISFQLLRVQELAEAPPGS